MNRRHADFQPAIFGRVDQHDRHNPHDGAQLAHNWRTVGAQLGDVGPADDRHNSTRNRRFDGFDGFACNVGACRVMMLAWSGPWNVKGLIVATLLAAMAVCGFVGWLIGNLRGAPGLGLVLGAVAGPVGWIVSWICDRRPQCPKCRTHVDPLASICPACLSILPPMTPASVPSEPRTTYPKLTAAAARRFGRLLGAMIPRRRIKPGR